MNTVRGKYGELESNPITDEVRAVRDAIEFSVHLEDEALKRITRLRLVSDPGFPLWDLSYCYGELTDGTPVRVVLPQSQFSKRSLKLELLNMCKNVGVYGKGLGIFDHDVISVLS